MIPREVYEETLLQFFAPIRPFLEDPSVSEVMINGPDQIFIERKGKLYKTDATFDSCLLYTSDAADDLLCVDLGGRRSIKKKT